MVHSSVIFTLEEVTRLFRSLYHADSCFHLAVAGLPSVLGLGVKFKDLVELLPTKNTTKK